MTPKEALQRIYYNIDDSTPCDNDSPSLAADQMRQIKRDMKQIISALLQVDNALKTPVLGSNKKRRIALED